MTTVLHQLPPYDFLPSLSPFCLKVQVALRLKGVPSITKDTLFAKTVNVRGKLPYLVLGGEGHEDSTNILRVLDAKAPAGPKLFPQVDCVDLLEDWADESLSGLACTRSSKTPRAGSDSRLTSPGCSRSRCGWAGPPSGGGRPSPG